MTSVSQPVSLQSSTQIGDINNLKEICYFEDEMNIL
jgi:hypothetical protein